MEVPCENSHFILVAGFEFEQTSFQKTMQAKPKYLLKRIARTYYRKKVFGGNVDYVVCYRTWKIITS